MKGGRMMVQGQDVTAHVKSVTITPASPSLQRAADAEQIELPSWSTVLTFRRIDAAQLYRILFGWRARLWWPVELGRNRTTFVMREHRRARRMMRNTPRRLQKLTGGRR